ncbi:MAG: GTPase HflX [Desulfovibrio sp.]
MVLVGDAGSIYIPELPRSRQGAGRLRGLRLIHTHLRGEKLSEEDLMDLVFLRLDSISALNVDSEGRPHLFHLANILPGGKSSKGYQVHDPVRWEHADFELEEMVQALEDEFKRHDQAVETAGDDGEKAILVSVSTAPHKVQQTALEELEDLAKTAGLVCTGTMIQRVGKVNPKFILGKGKLADLEVRALMGDAQIILFDQDLSPAQMRNLAKLTERRVIDRTQLILDIFAQRATSRAGKLQVESAQLKYTLPRLVGQNRAMSRLVGGIGGRGPGETKLEIDRRRARDRMTNLKKELKKVSKQRFNTRERRARAGVPIISLVGYTNAGKSTLLNTLTGSNVLAENKLFATLDPTSRRIRFPEDKEVVVTDTVGFIRRLPPDLKEAFKATLEELESADIMLLVADAAHPELASHIEAVESILADMELDQVERVLVLNKWDLIPEEGQEELLREYPDAVTISAKNRKSLRPLVDAVFRKIPWEKVR